MRRAPEPDLDLAAEHYDVVDVSTAREMACVKCSACRVVAGELRQAIARHSAKLGRAPNDVLRALHASELVRESFFAELCDSARLLDYGLALAPKGCRVQGYASESCAPFRCPRYTAAPHVPHSRHGWPHTMLVDACFRLADEGFEAQADESVDEGADLCAKLCAELERGRGA